MYETLARASPHQLVDRRNRYFAAQPFPIAVFLGRRRLELVRVTTLVQFVESASPELVRSLLRRIGRPDRRFQHCAESI